MTDASLAAPVDTVPAPRALADRVQQDGVRLFLAHWRGGMSALGIITVAVAVAWSERLPLPIQVAWCLLSEGCVAVQSLASWHMERAPSLAVAMPRWMPVLNG